MVDKIFRDPIVVARSADNVRRLLSIMNTALNNNPYERPVMVVPPTLAVSASSDGTLGAIVQMANGTALSAAASQRVAWYGGVPEITGSAYVRLPVTSILPTASGGNAGGSNNSWANAAEVMTDATVIEFCVYTGNAKYVMFQVDGQYVNLTGDLGIATAPASADALYKLTFATRKTRRIRVLMPTVNSSGPAMLKFIRCTATCSFWKPSQANVLRVGWHGDSYSEGTNGAVTVHPTPNASWPTLTCELLGLRDCRQIAVGATGYLSTSSGTRSSTRDQIPRWSSQAPFDLFVFANGYNDSANTPAAITAEVLYCLQLLRASYPTPVVVLGCQAGSSGPSAAQIATDTAISAAVTAFNDALCKFAPVSTDTPTWLNGTGRVGTTNASGNSDVYVDPDSIHPTLAGQEYLAFRSAAAIRTAVESMI